MARRRDFGRHGRQGATRDVDPEDFFGDSRRRALDRKTLQLCAQARQAVGYALSCDFSDAVISDLYVVDVRPDPDGSRLLVTVGHWEEHGREEVLERLKRASGVLRAAVARAVNRKKAPTLVFEVAMTEVPDDA